MDEMNPSTIASIMNDMQTANVSRTKQTQSVESDQVSEPTKTKYNQSPRSFEQDKYLQKSLKETQVRAQSNTTRSCTKAFIHLGTLFMISFDYIKPDLLKSFVVSI